MNYILSILTPSIQAHRQARLLLYEELKKQRNKMYELHPTLGEVELRWNEADGYLGGGPSIGKNRDNLVKIALGKYLCFLDADDFPAPNYIETLVRLCLLDRDVVTFRSFTVTDFYWTLINMSLDNSEDEQATPIKIVHRKPWLVCPVRSEYAKKFDFPDINYSEDSIWMEQVLTLCKTEAHTDQILHSYRHSAKTSEADKIINAGCK
jgi:hypothetical protein